MCQIKHMPILHIEIPPAAPNNLPLPPKTTQTKKKRPPPHPSPQKSNYQKYYYYLLCFFFNNFFFIHLIIIPKRHGEPSMVPSILKISWLNRVFVLLIDPGVYKDECFYINPHMSVYLLSRNLVKHSEAREQEIKNQENLSEQADE